MDQNFHLVCVHPFHKYERGQKITDAIEIATLLDDREHHFVRVPVPSPGNSVEVPPDEIHAAKESL